MMPVFYHQVFTSVLGPGSLEVWAIKSSHHRQHWGSSFLAFFVLLYLEISLWKSNGVNTKSLNRLLL